MKLEQSEEQLDQIFGALANRTRRAILTRSAEGEATVNELASPFELSMPAISRHIRVLEQAGLVSQGKGAQYRPCTLEVEPLELVSHWTDKYRRKWQERFDRMDSYIEQPEKEQDREIEDE